LQWPVRFACVLVKIGPVFQTSFQKIPKKAM
jgi:hypothetical protein